MKFKKFSFISLITIFIISMFGIISNIEATDYQFDTKCSSQNLSNKDSFVIDFNLTNEYENYLNLDTFLLTIKYNKNLFDFKGVTTGACIKAKDITVENLGDAVVIKFNPKEPRIIPFSNSYTEILKANFICKSDSCYHRSYFQTNIVDCNTEEQLLSKFTEITIKNNQKNNIQATNNSTKNSSTKESTDCHLKSIVPNVGVLNPSFDPNILKYKMEVPQEIQEVYFDIVPMSENTNVRVNKHRLGAPGTTTYINITSKNKSGMLSYLIEVKRSINSSTPESSSKVGLKNSGNVKVRGKIKNNSTKSAKSKHKRSKTKRKGKSSDGTDEEEFDDDEDEDASEDNFENNEQNDNSKNESSSIKNNKVYWIAILVVLVLSLLTYLFFKKKTQFSKNKDNTSESDINNFFEK